MRDIIDGTTDPERRRAGFAPKQGRLPGIDPTLTLLVKDGRKKLDLIDPKLKDTNPKDAIGSDKIPLHLWPETATVLGALGFLDGALKYGRSNSRVAGVKASVYIDAARRHLNAWFEGEDYAPDSGVHHLGHALACIAIIVDAMAAGKLTDDRMVKGGYAKFVEEMTPHVKRLKDLHRGKDPKHYTIQDSKEEAA